MQTVMKVSKVDEKQGRIHFTPVSEKEGGDRAGEFWRQGVPVEQLSGVKVGDVATVTVSFVKKVTKEAPAK